LNSPLKKGRGHLESQGVLDFYSKKRMGKRGEGESKKGKVKS